MTATGARGLLGDAAAPEAGIKPEHTVRLLQAPDGFALDDLPPGVELRYQPRDPLDVIVSFHTRRADRTTAAG